MQYSLVYTQAANTMTPSASSGNNAESYFFPDIAQFLHVFLHLISDVLPSEPALQNISYLSESVNARIS